MARLGVSVLLLLCLLPAKLHAQTQTMTTQQLLTRYVNQRFGMFIHYNMNTYYAGWGENRVAPTTFAPPNVDCHTFTDQWAAAAKAAGMKFGLLTTKHHDGFAIWPSKAAPPTSSPYGTTPYTIAESAVPTMDVVKCYVDSFRAQGLDPDLYFSIWDPNNGIGSQSGHNTAPGTVDWKVVGPYVTAQITELLTNYGDIPLFVFDGYAWLTGHQMVPYQQIRALIHKLQPNTIIMDHNGGVPWEVDTEYFEEPLGVKVPNGNVTVGSQGQTIAKNGDWFWDSAQAGTGYLSATDIANELKATEPNYTNFILDCPPNLQGLLDAPVVAVLGQVAQAWTPKRVARGAPGAAAQDRGAAHRRIGDRDQRQRGARDRRLQRLGERREQHPARHRTRREPVDVDGGAAAVGDDRSWRGRRRHRHARGPAPAPHRHDRRQHHRLQGAGEQRQHDLHAGRERDLAGRRDLPRAALAAAGPVRGPERALCASRGRRCRGWRNERDHRRASPSARAVRRARAGRAARRGPAAPPGVGARAERAARVARPDAEARQGRPAGGVAARSPARVAAAARARRAARARAAARGARRAAARGRPGPQARRAAARARPEGRGRRATPARPAARARRPARARAGARARADPLDKRGSSPGAAAAATSAAGPTAAAGCS